MALAACIDRAWPRTILLLILAALIHPLMAAYAIAFVPSTRSSPPDEIRLALILCGAFLTIAGTAFFLAHRTLISPAYRQAVSFPRAPSSSSHSGTGMKSSASSCRYFSSHWLSANSDPPAAKARSALPVCFSESRVP
jgi:hypothetical protein